MTKSGRISKKASPKLQVDIKAFLRGLAKTKKKTNVCEQGELFNDDSGKVTNDLQLFENVMGDENDSAGFNLHDVASVYEIHNITKLLR
jgi:hypothetical protein